MAFTTNVAGNMLLASGATVTVGGTDVGAMMGETTFTVDVEHYHPDLYGAWGDVDGTGFVIGAVARVTTTMAETSYFQLSVLMDHLGQSSDANSRWYGSGALGQLASSDYQEVIVTGMETCGGSSVTITIPYAYVDSGVNVTLSDDSITMFEVEFVSAYDPVHPSRLPARVAIEVGPEDVPIAEADALVWLYNNSGGTSWTSDTNWLTYPTVGDWFGVTVAGGHVTKINLGNNNLTGNIGAWAIQDLPYLAELQFSQDDVAGNIGGWDLPDSLTLLELYSTDLSGDLSGWTLPSGLVTLRMSGTDISGDISGWTLPAPLEYLYLQITDVEGDIGEWSLPAGLIDFFIYTSSASGDISGWTLPATLEDLRFYGTSVEGAISDWTLPASLTDIMGYGTSVSGDIGAGWVLPAGMERLYLHTCGVSGNIGAWTLGAALEYLLISATSVTGDISGWTVPATMKYLSIGDTTVSKAPGMGSAVVLQTLRYEDCALSQADVDAVLAAVYARRVAFTHATPDLDISGTNSAPGGVYQDGDPPTTGLEYVFEIATDPESEGYFTWTVAWNGGTAP